MIFSLFYSSFQFCFTLLPLYITITVLLRILEIEDEPLLLIYKSLARSVSLSLEMPRLSLSFCRRSRSQSRSLPRCHCRDRLQESQSRPIEQPINLKGGISTNKYIFIWMCQGWVWVKIVQSRIHIYYQSIIASIRPRH